MTLSSLIANVVLFVRQKRYGLIKPKQAWNRKQQLRRRCCHLANSTKHSVVLDIGPLAPLSENMTSSTKPEIYVHNALHCHQRRTDSWDSIPTNKLFSIKPVLGKNKPRTPLCRRDETVLTRLRIGHSRVTHSYLLSRESQPICDHCKCVFTVKHMLLECPSTAVVELKCFFIQKSN